MKRLLSWRLLVVVVVLAWAAVGGPYGAVPSWALFGYLCWRAFPAVRSDVGRLLSAGRSRAESNRAGAAL